ncbi:hypothetical protein FJZ18_02740 [Candidatus Pacearchaeota archaeon]|nr:hypothetical protein [Candidatus Pacearchaeota archaeon]
MTKINGKRGASDILHSTIAFIFILLLFTFGMWYYIYQQKSGASVWEDYYAKQLTIVMNSARPGDIIVLDVHKATEIAQKASVSFESIFLISDQETCVRLSQGRKTCYSFFNRVDAEIELRTGVPGNVIEIKVLEEKE